MSMVKILQCSKDIGSWRSTAVANAAFGTINSSTSNNVENLNNLNLSLKDTLLIIHTILIINKIYSFLIFSGSK